MTYMEKTIIRKFIEDKILSFYRHHVNDTLFGIKLEHLNFVYDTLNNFDNNLNFNVDIFDHFFPFSGH